MIRPSRRGFLAGIVRGMAGSVLLPSSRRAVAAEEGAAPVETGPLTARVTRPYDAETPVREFASYLTPTHRFFVRSHFGPPPPEALSEDRWRLRIDGLVKGPQEFRLAELRTMDAATITAVVQCSGNGRTFYRPRVPGVQWERGAVGNAEWTGVRLRDLLRRCGVKPDARHVRFRGADRPVVEKVPLFVRSVPIEKALHPDTLLAYEMNGRPLPLLHGAPLRVITPGWMADACIKWLTDITVQEEEAQGYYMQTAYRVPVHPVEPGHVGTVPSTPVERMVVKSLIAVPQQGERLQAGRVTVQGVAWSGEARIVAVEVSIDGGARWEAARLTGEDRPHAWRQWQWQWKAAPGQYTIVCRATDSNGDSQPATSVWNPSGFLWNGWDRVSVEISA